MVTPKKSTRFSKQSNIRVMLLHALALHLLWLRWANSEISGEFCHNLIFYLSQYVFSHFGRRIQIGERNYCSTPHGQDPIHSPSLSPTPVRSSVRCLVLQSRSHQSHNFSNDAIKESQIILFLVQTIRKGKSELVFSWRPFPCNSLLPMPMPYPCLFIER